MKWLMLLPLALGTAPLSCEEPKPERERFEVWRSRQEIRTKPVSYSRIVAWVDKGTILEVLQEAPAREGRKPWARVRRASGPSEDGPSEDRDVDGWTIIDAPPRRAGSLAGPLGGGASPASLSMAAKAFEDLSAQIAALRPDVEAAFQEIVGASIEPAALADFARSAGLRPPDADGAAADRPLSGAEATRDRLELRRPEAPRRGSSSLDEMLKRRQAKRDEIAGTRRSVEDYTEEDERAIGDATARSLLARLKALPADDPVSVYVRKVGVLLSRTTARPWIPWKFVVVDSKVPNAISAPYGHVLITTGALDMVRTEAELAFILAHEIVHVEAKHGLAHLVRAYFDVAKRAARERLDSMSRLLPPDVKARRDELERRMDELSDLVLKGYGLPDELEADRGALELLARAGYDPRAGISVLERLAQAHAGRKDDAPRIFRSHPSPQERIDAVRRAVARLPRGGVTATRRFEAAVR